MTLTCPRCTGPLYPRLVKRTDEGWQHVACPYSRADAVRLYLAGHPAEHVAQVVGASPQSVRNWVRAAGHRMRPRNHREYMAEPVEFTGRWVRHGLVWRAAA